MMKKLLMLALVFVSTQAFAEKIRYAETFFAEGNSEYLVPVKENALKVVGRGVVLKDGVQGVVLACQTLECMRLRFVYVSSKNEAFFFGPVYSFDQSYPSRVLNDDEIKANATQVLKDIASYSRKGKAGFGAMTSFVSGFAVSFIAVFVTGPVAIVAIAAGVSGMGLSLVGKSTFLEKVNAGQLVEVHGITAANDSLTDKKGWNWSANPKSVSEKTLMKLQSQITHGAKALSF